MDPGEQTTGTRDEHYDLVSVLYHALHAVETMEAYILNAEATGDERLASFFREALGDAETAGGAGEGDAEYPRSAAGARGCAGPASGGRRLSR
jgi:hypothetical protein